MINSKYIAIPERIFKEYRRVFSQPDFEARFIFLWRYFKFIERDNSPLKNIMILEDPTVNYKKIKEIQEFNSTIKEFLLMLHERPIINYDSKVLVRNAHFYIGVGYEFGVFNFPIDINLSFLNYRISAKLKSSEGTYKLAQCYEKGQGIRKSDIQALCFYRCGAKLGLTDAMYTFGMIMLQGNLGAEKDEKMGFSYLQYAVKTADDMCPFPLFDMGILFEKGTAVDLHIDKIYSFEMYNKGAELGDSNSMFKLAQAYENEDLVVTKDMNKSINYYIQAASNGHIDAMYYLMEYYKKGSDNYLKESDKEYFYWSLKAACKFDQCALYKCGECYEEGYGVEQDVLEAYWFYNIALDAGNSNAKCKVKELRKIMNNLNQVETSRFNFCKMCLCLN